MAFKRKAADTSAELVAAAAGPGVPGKRIEPDFERVEIRGGLGAAPLTGGGQNIRTADDLVKAEREVIFGSTSPAAITSQHALVLKNYLGAPIKVIYGYKGTKGVSLAMQKGEVNASCGMFESSVKGAFARHIKSGKMKIMMQFGPDKAVTYFGDATRLYERMKSPKDRQVLDVIFRQTQLARPHASPRCARQSSQPCRTRRCSPMRRESASSSRRCRATRPRRCWKNSTPRRRP